jgi:uncharacterized membrane protein
MSKYEGINASFRVKRWGYVNEFAIYSFVGWLYETICESIFAHHLVLNRGLLHLPVCPIYGVGAFIFLWIMERLSKQKPLIVFAFGAIVTTAIEYAAALLLESVFNLKLWDYSAWICNFQGRVSLISSLIFGVGCLCAYNFRPKFERYCYGKKWVKAAAIVEIVLAAVDFVTVLSGL